MLFRHNRGSGFDGDGFGPARYLGQTEVENLGVSSLGDENVGRFNVTMKDALGMSSIERVCNLDAYFEHAIQFHRAIANQVLQGCAEIGIEVADALDAAH